MSTCKHEQLRFDSIEWEDGYRQPAPEVIQRALRIDEIAKKGKKAKKFSNLAASGDEKLPPVRSFSGHTFPAPLVEHDDELYHDPEYPPQSAQEWFDEESRNAITTRRRTVYVVAPPEIPNELEAMRDSIAPWEPTLSGKPEQEMVAPSKTLPLSKVLKHPLTEGVADYLSAFYTGLPVRVLEEPRLRFVAWDQHSESNGMSKSKGRIGLQTNKETIGVRYRRSPDGLFMGQLNLNDVLDAALEILPANAYALLVLVHQDLYEDEEDDFCCGRAFGGSRVAAVSTARYHPALDGKQKLDLDHSWPPSHCCKASEEAASCKSVPIQSKKQKQKKTVDTEKDCALAAAVHAFNVFPPPRSLPEFHTLWLGRVCKTASHELGHCFGIDHCTYFACIMQGTANVVEDSRQPPYLCPVDLVKVLTATGSSEEEHCRALLAFCGWHAGDRMFAAFAAWLEVRLRQIS